MKNNQKELIKIFQQRKQNHLNVVDLFAGCGGLSIGFKKAGFNILAAIDFDKDSIDSLKHNKVTNNPINIDLFDPKAIDKISQQIDLSCIDLVIGGPPCQGFSLTGPRNYDDKRNKLYKSMKDLVKKSKPKAFLIENVKGMATLYNGNVKQDIINEFSLLGYNVFSDILNSKHYCVPQSRERLFFVGIRKDINSNFNFPKRILTEKNFVTCRDAISDLPSLDDLVELKKYTKKPQSVYQELIRKNSKRLINHLPTKHTQKVIEVIKQVPEGGNHKDLPPGVGSSRKFNEAWTRYHGDKPSRTIDTGHRNHFHYLYNRVPSIRENLRLQSFPDTFELSGSKTSQNIQIGNAVPVLLAKVIAENIYEQIKDN